MASSTDSKRIRQAMAQYWLGLDNWRGGYETLALASLYMGVETLTPVVRRDLQRTSDETGNSTAHLLGVDVDAVRLTTQRGLLCGCPQVLDVMVKRKVSAEVEVAIRREQIFQGDIETYHDAREASNGFEHGYLDLGAIRSRAVDTRDKTARYLRHAILKSLTLDDDVRTALQSSPYDKPLGPYPVARYFRGLLVGESDELAADNEPYPRLTWKTSVTGTSLTDEGETSLTFSENCQAVTHDSVRMHGHSMEMWDPNAAMRGETPT